MKKCEFCGASYTPSGGQTKKQKYCSRRCKDREKRRLQKERGDVRGRKGGYNRLTYIKCWLRQIDLSVPCFYCKTRIFPEDSWVLDHKQPLSSLSTRTEMLNPDNLCIACHPCNVKKGSTPIADLNLEDFVNAQLDS